MDEYGLRYVQYPQDRAAGLVQGRVYASLAQGQGSLAGGGPGPIHADLLHGVLRLVNARRVAQAQQLSLIHISTGCAGPRWTP